MKYIAQFREVPQVNVALPENVGWTVIKAKKEIQDCLAEPVPKANLLNNANAPKFPVLEIL